MEKVDTNLYDYLEWRGDVKLEHSPFNELDGIILARLSYIPMELFFGKDNTAFDTIGKITKTLLNVENIKDKVLEKEDIRFLELLSTSERFSGLKLGNYVNIYDEIKQIQFSACVVKLDSKQTVVVYRGTDNTLIGWKEDFNMGFICPLDSQKIALDYFASYAKKHRGTFIVAGHSKGGNLAVYTGIFAQPKLQARIDRIYNYDGPGFDDSVIVSPGYALICEKIKMFVPQGSIVGTLLGHKEEHQVILARKGTAIAQHDIYSWCMRGTRFVYEKNLTGQSRYFRSAMKEWLGSMSVEEREVFIDTVYSVVKETNCKTLEDLQANVVGNTKAMTKALKGLSERDRKNLVYGVGLFIKSAVNVGINETKILTNRTNVL